MATTNKRLMNLMFRHSLSPQEVADMLFVSVDIVKGWSFKKNSTRPKRMPRSYLEILEVKLGETNICRFALWHV
jgi:DNA-binding transcriptional regulator YiaG